MRNANTIGLDLVKNVFQAHGADASGAVMFRKKLRRAQVLEFFSRQPVPGAHLSPRPGAGTISGLPGGL
jgi:transposase